MRKLVTLLIVTVLFTSCGKEKKDIISSEKSNTDYTKFVNPFIGTSKMGHVFPGATAPFGMVQLSPQTNFEAMFKDDGTYNKETYEYCAGYQYRDSTIIGFAHTNFSGTGHSDLGDLLVMPTVGELVLDPLETKEGNKGFYSTFTHEKEEASPGYYKVNLDSYHIKAELTASERVGFHQYTFPKSNESHIILDLVYNIYHHDNKNVWTFIRVENDSLVTGYRQTKGWARDKKVFLPCNFQNHLKAMVIKNMIRLHMMVFTGASNRRKISLKWQVKISELISISTQLKTKKSKSNSLYLL